MMPIPTTSSLFLFHYPVGANLYLLLTDELSYFFLIMICSLVYLESMSKIWRRSA